ncbi:trypsin-1-like [Atheta coriaria]|uniref:trypsin-1-like n=1 Tax=Dalotia coriaria TaxID=877792 RepID=UPI0031F43697
MIASNSRLSVFFILLFLVIYGNLATVEDITKTSAAGRIVNGTHAKRGEIPYIVSIRRFNRHSCGGSILDARHVLTAAHCVFDRAVEELQVQYGVLDIGDGDSNVINVTNTVTHSEYFQDYGNINDIAIITLEEDIVFSDMAQPTVLPEAFAPTPAGAHSILAGWGLNGTGGARQQHLQRVDLVIYSDDDCEEAHPFRTFREYHICSGVPEGGKGQCNGDSGGPLYAGGVQVGIVSWSVKPCTIQGYPGVFVKVANYVPWIHNQISHIS